MKFTTILLVLFSTVASYTSIAQTVPMTKIRKEKTTPKKAPKPEDSDGDGVIDKYDNCKNKKGPKSNNGCPVKIKDSDKDGVPDEKDDCPKDKGKPNLRGCPDSDGDGIIDKNDDCKNDKGFKRYGGCPIPDIDGDGFNDEEDGCKNTFSSSNGGCPPPRPKDTDGDGVPDKNDDCLSKAGLERYKGCPIPDSDGDGFNDEEDKCPNQEGVYKYAGCPIPDSDGDGINDEEDQCPKKSGSMKFNGCPDSDKDGIPDRQDNCPNLFGKEETNGCPDRDGDGYIDSKDRCPDEQGEDGGCPPKRRISYYVDFPSLHYNQIKIEKDGSDQMEPWMKNKIGMDLISLGIQHAHFEKRINFEIGTSISQYFNIEEISGSIDENTRLEQISYTKFNVIGNILIKISQYGKFDLGHYISVGPVLSIPLKSKYTNIPFRYQTNDADLLNPIGLYANLDYRVFTEGIDNNSFCVKLGIKKNLNPFLNPDLNLDYNGMGLRPLEGRKTSNLIIYLSLGFSFYKL